MGLCDEDWYGFALGSCVLLYVVWGCYSEWLFRKTAASVRGTVLRRFPRARYTSYYLTYTLQGVDGIVEYCAPNGSKRYKEGDELEVLIDPAKHPLDAQVPTLKDLSPAGLEGGSCSLGGSPLVGLWDVLYFVAGLAAIGYACWGG